MSEVALTPKDGAVLFVLIICRISTERQDPRSLDDQVALCKGFVQRRFKGRVEFVVISGRGSGERLDRHDYLRALDEVGSGRFDLCIAEDLSRVCRRAHAAIFCETCEDAGTRFIGINDPIDTADAGWRLNTAFASIKHEMANRDTSERIRRSLRNRHANGGVVQFVVFGYEKPDGAQSDAEITIPDHAKEVYRRWFQMLRDGATYAEVADFLNDNGVPTGRYCKRKRWDVAMVARVTRNPILKGWRVRNRYVTRRLNKTGERKAVKAPPSELLVRKCPHLAVFSEEYFDETIAMLDARNGKYKRKLVNGKDLLAGRPRKRTPWPGQHVRCGVCGRAMRYGGNGQLKNLICQGAVEHKCWNGVSVNGPLAAKKVSAAVREAIAALPDFVGTIVEKVRAATAARLKQGKAEAAEVAKRLKSLDSKIDNLVGAFEKLGYSPALDESLRRQEAERAALRLRQKQLAAEAAPQVELPSMEEVRRLVNATFDELAATSQEFARWMKLLIPSFEVLPVRGRYCGLPAPRAYITLCLTNLVPADVAAAAPELMTHELVVDLFVPPKPLRHRTEVVARSRARMKQRDIAVELKLHLPEVQRALAIERKMTEEGVTDPYEVMEGPSDDYARLRRHRHNRYRFEPLPGYPRQA